MWDQRRIWFPIVLFLLEGRCCAFFMLRPGGLFARLHTPSSSSFIDVFDGVLDKDTTSSLHNLLMRLDDETNMADTTRVIDRHEKMGVATNQKTTEKAIEMLLRSVVEELGDDSRFIEWWWRDEWLPFEAHRDVSEGEAEKPYDFEDDCVDRKLRCPRHGHVLYLQVAREARGPTCVFKDRGLVSTAQGPNLQAHGTSEKATARETDEERRVNRDRGVRAGAERNPVVSMAVVPTVEGRVLRFRGDLLHSVPRPSMQWALEGEDPNIVDDSDNDDDDGACDDAEIEDEEFYEDEDEEWIERNVLLFNTWDGAPQMSKTDQRGDGIEDFTIIRDEKKPETKINHETSSSILPPLLRCRPRQEWKVQSPDRPTKRVTQTGESDDAASSEPVILGVPLLGDRFRRQRKANTLVLVVPSGRGMLQKAVLSKESCTIFDVIDVEEVPEKLAPFCSRA